MELQVDAAPERGAAIPELLYERRDQLWYFVNRSHLLFYGLDLPERPLDQPPANWPERVVGRGSVPYDWPTWQDARGR